jgi:hypothetical protein
LVRRLRVILIWLVAAAAAAQTPSGLPTAAEINGVLKDLADITGFRIRRQLPFEMVTREQVNRYLQEQIKTAVKPNEIRAEELTLKKFGFVPANFDLRRTTVELLTEQAAAFYDFHRKKLFISDWAAENMREEALVHELGHALADQNYPIQKFLSGGKDESEASLARETVVEGQASWLTLEYVARKAGRTLADPATANMLLRSPSDAGDDEYPVFSKAPLYLKVTLIFPYDQGQKFQQALFLKEGKRAFGLAFAKPPVSTAQILHPDKYFSTEAPVSPELPRPAAGMKALTGGTVGELDQQVILRLAGNPQAAAESLAARLKGGSYRIDEPKHGEGAALLYVSEWESEDAAAQYFAAWQKADRAKWKQVDVSAESANLFQGKSEDGYFRVTLKGTRVTAQEGFAQPFAGATF